MKMSLLLAMSTKTCGTGFNQEDLKEELKE
jgi:hypothetical protein